MQLLTIVVVLLLGALLLAGLARAETRFRLPVNSNVLFVTVSPEPYVATSLALVAQLLKARNKEVNVSMVSYRGTGRATRGLLSKREKRFFQYKNHSLSYKEQQTVNHALAHSPQSGFSLLWASVIDNYEDEVKELRICVADFRPTFAVVGVMGISAMDLFDNLNIPYVIFYPYASLGLLGIGENSAVLSGFYRRQGTTDPSFWQKVQHWLGNEALQHPILHVRQVLNAKRANMHLDALSSVRNGAFMPSLAERPIIVQSVFGFEYARHLSPLLRLVGFPVNEYEHFLPSSSISSSKNSSNSSSNKRLTAWIGASDRPIVYVRMPQEATPSATHLQAIVGGAMQAGARVLLCVRDSVLTRMGTNGSELERYYRQGLMEDIEIGETQVAIDGVPNPTWPGGQVDMERPTTGEENVTLETVLVVQPEDMGAPFVPSLPQQPGQQPHYSGPSYVSLLVHQGDIYGVLESIRTGLPTLVAPMTSECAANAARLRDLGVAMRLHVSSIIDPVSSRSSKEPAIPSYSAATVELALRVLLNETVANDVKMRLSWLRQVNTLAGAGTLGSVLFIEELLDLGYLHLIPVIRHMHWAAVAGIDAALLLLLMGTMALWVCTKLTAHVVRGLLIIREIEC